MYGYGDYGYNFEYTREELGRSCDKARWDLLAAAAGEGSDPINLNIGAIYSGNYGPMPLESIGCAAGRFDKLCDALETLPDSRVIDSLKFHHFNIKSDRMISKVESAIKTKHIKELEFEKCFGSCPTKGINLVSHFLEGNQTVEKLTVDVGILNAGFTNALRDHPTLETLDLANFCFSPRNFVPLMEAVKDKSDVSIRYEGHHDGRMEIAHLIPPVLATNPQMQKFRLRGAVLTNYHFRPGEDEDAVLNSFARALSTNSNLKQLTLDCNGVGKDILLKAIYDDSSLNALAMSNHTCRILIDSGNFIPTFKSINEDHEWIQGGGTSISRKSKLLCAIGTFDESCIDVKRVSEGPSDSELLPKLIPMMLEFVQGVHIFEQIDNAKLERLAFKNVYELMRNIVAPSFQPTHDLHGSQAGGVKRKRDVAGAEN
eukprot:scaffold4867_cov136-Skeletonema_dohrnii-CCMP3373.AAC.6